MESMADFWAMKARPQSMVQIRSSRAATGRDIFGLNGGRFMGEMPQSTPSPLRGGAGRGRAGRGIGALAPPPSLPRQGGGVARWLGKVVLLLQLFIQSRDQLVDLFGRGVVGEGEAQDAVI